MSEETPENETGEPADPPAMDAGMQSRLLEPFPKAAIGHRPQRNNKTGNTFQLAYVGHAAVTKRLCEVDPHWTWRPLVIDEHGRPQFESDRNGNKVGFWIELTIGGVSRLGYGSVMPNAFDCEKQLIGDALRNAAMRFGVAVDLWHMGDLSSTLAESDSHDRPMVHKDAPGSDGPPPAASAVPPRPPAPSGPPPQPELAPVDDVTSEAVGKLVDGDMVALDTLDAVEQLAKSQPLGKMPKKLLINLVVAKHEVMEGLAKWKPGSLDRNIAKYGSKIGAELSPDLGMWQQGELVDFASAILGVKK